MIQQFALVTIRVNDQDRALDFWVNQVGFEQRQDISLGDAGRWLEVAPPGATTRLSLEQARADRPAGGFTGYVLAAADIETTYRDLTGRGVEFTEPPTQQPWGKQAQFADQDGNVFVLVQE